MSNLLDQTCEGCKYRNVENVNVCRRYIKQRGDQKVLCDEGANLGDEPSEPSSSTCLPELCPSECYLPYPKEYFTEVGMLDNSNSLYSEEGIKTDEELQSIKNQYDPNDTSSSEYILNLSNSTPASSFMGVYNDGDNPGTQFKCGPLVPGAEYPVLPSSDEYTKYFSSVANVMETTDWSKIRSSELISNVSAENISDNGVDLNIFVNGTFINIETPSDGLQALLRYEGLDTSLLTLTEIYNDTVGSVSGIVEVKEFLTSDNSSYLDGDSPEPFPRKLSEGIIREWSRNKMFSERLTGTTTNMVKVNRLLDVFMISSNDSTNVELERCLNQLLLTDTGSETDEDYVRRIGNYTSIHELGQHPRDVKYIEDKIKKFLGANTDDLVDCFLKSNIQYENICQNGFSSRPMEMLSNLLKVKDGLTDNSEIYEEKLVLSKLLKYIPDVMKKIIDISEKFEMQRCDQVSTKTMLYKEIYRDLFLENDVIKFGLPDLGIGEFFEDFNRNIYTKIILLIFFAYIFSKIVALFKVNISV